MVASFSCHIPLTIVTRYLITLISERGIWLILDEWPHFPVIFLLLVTRYFCPIWQMTRLYGQTSCQYWSNQPGLIFPSWWNVRQKVAISTLCVLCGISHCEKMYIMYCTVSTVRCEQYIVYSMYCGVTYGCEWMMVWKYPASERCHIWMGGGELNLLSKYFRTTC